MITTLKLDLGPDQLRALGVRLTGKNKPATRADVQKWAYKLLGDSLDFDDKPGKTELRNIICPKCQKPIPVAVPKVTKAPGARMSAATIKAVTSQMEATIKALDKLATECEESGK